MVMTVLEFDTRHMSTEDIRNVADWLTALGVVPKHVRTFGVVVRAASSYELHLSQFVLNEQGKKRIDLARNEVVTTPLVVDLGPTRCWPACLDALAVDEMHAPRDLRHST